jgi:hypothetical protein
MWTKYRILVSIVVAVAALMLAAALSPTIHRDDNKVPGTTVN